MVWSAKIFRTVPGLTVLAASANFEPQFGAKRTGGGKRDDARSTSVLDIFAHSPSVQLMLVAALAIRWLLAVLLLVAGAAKLGRSTVFADSVARYHLLPSWLVPIFARALPILECILGLMLATGIVVTPASIACAGLFGTFGGAVAVNLMRGERFDCGCGGSTASEISWRHVVQNAVLGGLSVFVAAVPSVLTLSGDTVVNEPAANHLLTVPLGIILLCASSRLIAPSRTTVSIVLAQRHRAHRSVPPTGNI